MTSLPTQQKAIIFNTDTHEISLTTSAPIPETQEELLIKVHCTAITNGELTWAPFVNWPKHHVPCYDVSGVVLSVPKGSLPSHQFKTGDRVYGRIAAGREGSARQYATILPGEASLMPQNLTFPEASTVPMSAHTAWQALFEHGLITGSFTHASVPHIDDAGRPVLGQAEGKRVLILGAAGGVGIMAVQFAKLAGAYVVGTASGKNRNFLDSLRIDELIDYTKTSVAEYVSGGNDKFDLVLDFVGGSSMLDGWNGVKVNGVYVSVVPGFTEPPTGVVEGVRSKWFVMDARAEELAQISKFFDKGLLQTSVDSIWQLDEFEHAFAKTASGHARGKVVLQVE